MVQKRWASEDLLLRDLVLLTYLQKVTSDFLVTSLALEKARFKFWNASRNSSAQWLHPVIPSCYTIWWELPGSGSLEGIWDGFDLFNPSLPLYVPAMCLLFQFRMRQRKSLENTETWCFLLRKAAVCHACIGCGRAQDLHRECWKIDGLSSEPLHNPHTFGCMEQILEQSPYPLVPSRISWFITQWSAGAN